MKASQMHTDPLPVLGQRGRLVRSRARRQGAISAEETSILQQTMSRLPVANHIFLGSWMADNCQEGHSLRSAPWRDTGHTWDGGFTALPENWVTETMEVITWFYNPPGKEHLTSTWLSRLLRSGKGKHTHTHTHTHTIKWVRALVEYLRTWTWVA